MKLLENQISSRIWILLLGIALVLILRAWIDPDEPFVNPPDVDLAELQSDYYLEDFKTSRYRIDGSLHYVVSGEHLIHYPKDDTSHIQTPTLTLLEPARQWHMSSDKGLYSTDPDTFVLEGAVTMTRHLPRSITMSPQEANAVLTIKTQKLHYAIDSNIVSSDDNITITTEGWTLRSTGFESRINDGILTLSSNVEGHYEINR